MTQEDIIQTILKDSDYHLSLFKDDEINTLRDRIFIKTVRDKEKPFVNCIVRDKDIQLKPEEVVRQLYAARLIDRYGYPKTRLVFEYPVNFGRQKKSADIVILNKVRSDTAYIIVELKKPKLHGWQKPASILLQRHRGTDRGLDKRRADIPLSPQRSELL